MQESSTIVCDVVKTRNRVFSAFVPLTVKIIVISCERARIVIYVSTIEICRNLEPPSVTSLGLVTAFEYVRRFVGRYPTEMHLPTFTSQQFGHGP